MKAGGPRRTGQAPACYTGAVSADRITPWSRPGLELCAIGFLTLFLELALIRYLAGNVWNLGYFPNLVLVSVFVGMGVGFTFHQLAGPRASSALLHASAWSLLALALFFAGLALRERAYRLAGLTVLALAIGRVFLFDVWHFETLGRIVSFLVLGSVLLLLGYLYNRFGEKLREWL